MKQIYFLATILLFSLSQSYGQISYIEIGENPYFTNSSERRQFLPTSFVNAKQQFLFTNAELSNKNLINGSKIIGIQWYVVTDNTTQATVYDLYIDDDFTGSSLSNNATFAAISPTLVADDITDNAQGPGWHTATFDTPFIWDGTDNLVLQLCRTGWNQASDVIQVADTNGENRFITGYNHTCNSTTGYYSETFRPFFRLMVSTNTLGTENYEVENSIKLYPNPSTDFIHISGLTKTENYKIYNTIGAEISRGTISENEKINIKNYAKGLYLLNFEGGNTLKFIKQ